MLFESLTCWFGSGVSHDLQEHWVQNGGKIVESNNIDQLLKSVQYFITEDPSGEEEQTLYRSVLSLNDDSVLFAWISPQWIQESIDHNTRRNAALHIITPILISSPGSSSTRRSSNIHTEPGKATDDEEEEMEDELSYNTSSEFNDPVDDDDDNVDHYASTSPIHLRELEEKYNIDHILVNVFAFDTNQITVFKNKRSGR